MSEWVWLMSLPDSMSVRSYGVSAWGVKQVLVSVCASSNGDRITFPSLTKRFYSSDKVTRPYNRVFYSSDNAKRH